MWSFIPIISHFHHRFSFLTLSYKINDHIKYKIKGIPVSNDEVELKIEKKMDIKPNANAVKFQQFILFKFSNALLAMAISVALDCQNLRIGSNDQNVHINVLMIKIPMLHSQQATHGVKKRVFCNSETVLMQAK